jgi:hypothetical protein
MLTIALSMLLNHPATATATFDATVALATIHQAQVDRHEKAERIGRELDAWDGERQVSTALRERRLDERANPFEIEAFDPFEAGR